MGDALAHLPRAVRVRVPASSANLGPGFDSLGLALAWYDEVEVQLLERRSADAAAATLTVIGCGAESVGDPASNLVVRTLQQTLATVGMPATPLSVTCRNAIPQGRGLGSSAAAIVSGVAAAYALADPSTPPDLARILDTAATIEGHADNVAACVLGGFTIAWRGEAPVAPAGGVHDRGRWHAMRLDPWPDLAPIVLVPAHEASTSIARAGLPATVTHADAAATAGRSALLVAALTQRPDLLQPATQDWLHQEFRGAALRETSDLIATLRSDGLPAVFSGSGPSVLVLHDPDRASARHMPAGWVMHPIELDRDGVLVDSGPPGT